MPLITSEERSFLFNEAVFLQALPKSLIADLISIASVITFPKDGFVTKVGDDMNDFMIVLSGLIRANSGSSSGRQFTFTLMKPGEPVNMLSPFMNKPRSLEARAMEKTRCLWIKGEAFKDFVEKNPPLAGRMLGIAGYGLDIAYSRILDLMEKNVEQRIMRVLGSLYRKFGSPLLFTSVDIADIAGTTPESALRAMALLRDQNIIETRRGKIWIKAPEALKDPESGIYNIL